MSTKKTTELQAELKKTSTFTKTKVLAALGVFAVAVMTSLSSLISTLVSRAELRTQQLEMEIERELELREIAQTGADSEESLIENQREIIAALEAQNEAIIALQRQDEIHAWHLELLDYKLRREIFEAVDNEEEIERMAYAPPVRPQVEDIEAQALVVPSPTPVWERLDTSDE